MLNLDTHILLFALSGELTRREAETLASTRWGISAIVLWEIAKLVELGRVQIGIDSAEFAQQIASLTIWPIDLAVCRALRKLDFHSDPADELIAATSLVHNVPLVTRDARLRKSKVVALAK